VTDREEQRLDEIARQALDAHLEAGDEARLGLRLERSGAVEVGDVVLKPEALEALGGAPEDLAQAPGVRIAVPDGDTGEPVPVPLADMGAEDHARLLEALERERERAAGMAKLASDLAARMRERGCGPGTTVTRFLGEDW
jgi:hypothetical protein